MSNAKAKSTMQRGPTGMSMLAWKVAITVCLSRALNPEGWPGNPVTVHQRVQ